MKISHVLGFPLAEVKTQPKPKKPEKKPPQHKNTTTPLFQHFSCLKASHNKVVITCIVKHTSQFALKCETSKTQLDLLCDHDVLLYFFPLSICIFKGRFQWPWKRAFLLLREMSQGNKIKQNAKTTVASIGDQSYS